MADDVGKKQEIIPPSSGGNPPGEQYELFALIEVEKQRIDSVNRRTDLARQAIEASDAADKRQFDYHMARLKTEEESSKRGHELARKIFYYGGGAILAFAVLLFGMLFFGNDGQSRLALEVLITVGKGLGGGGVLFLIIQALRWLLRR